MEDAAKPIKTARTTRAKGFLQVNGVLDRVLSQLGLDKRLKEHALMNLWPAVVGDLLASRSRCLYIDRESQLVVAVKDASCGQELSLMKRQLMMKLSCLAPSLGVEVSGLRFDLRQWHEPEIFGYRTPDIAVLPEPSEDDLLDVKLSESDLAKIAELKVSLDNSNQTAMIAERIVSLFEKELRLVLWRRQNGYPICPECLVPAPRLCGSKAVCAVCFCASS